MMTSEPVAAILRHDPVFAVVCGVPAAPAPPAHHPPR
jgi:hypothetical protein